MGLYVGDAVFGNTILNNKSTQGYNDLFLAINEHGFGEKAYPYGIESAGIG